MPNAVLVTAKVITVVNILVELDSKECEVCN